MISPANSPLSKIILEPAEEIFLSSSESHLKESIFLKDTGFETYAIRFLYSFGTRKIKRFPKTSKTFGF